MQIRPSHPHVPEHLISIHSQEPLLCAGLCKAGQSRTPRFLLRLRWLARPPPLPRAPFAPHAPRHGLLHGHQKSRGTHSASVTSFPPSGGRLAPQGVQVELGQECRKSHHSPAAPERSQTRNRTAVELPPQKLSHSRLHPSPDDPTFTLSIAVGVAPEKILHIRHCRARQLSSPGAAPPLSLRHGTNETRQCRKHSLKVF